MSLTYKSNICKQTFKLASLSKIEYNAPNEVKHAYSICCSMADAQATDDTAVEKTGQKTQEPRKTKTIPKTTDKSNIKKTQDDKIDIL